MRCSRTVSSNIQNSKWSSPLGPGTNFHSHLARSIADACVTVVFCGKMPERCVIYGCSNTKISRLKSLCNCISSLHKHVHGIQSPKGADFFNELASLSPVISVTKRSTRKLNYNLLTNFLSFI